MLVGSDTLQTSVFCRGEVKTMKIKWLGHASFLITSKDGLKIVTDPYVVGGNIKYGEIPVFRGRGN